MRREECGFDAEKTQVAGKFRHSSGTPESELPRPEIQQMTCEFLVWATPSADRLCKGLHPAISDFRARIGSPWK